MLSRARVRDLRCVQDKRARPQNLAGRMGGSLSRAANTVCVCIFFGKVNNRAWPHSALMPSILPFFLHAVLVTVFFAGFGCNVGETKKHPTSSTPTSTGWREWWPGNESIFFKLLTNRFGSFVRSFFYYLFPISYEKWDGNGFDVFSCFSFGGRYFRCFICFMAFSFFLDSYSIGFLVGTYPLRLVVVCRFVQYNHHNRSLVYRCAFLWFCAHSSTLI